MRIGPDKLKNLMPTTRTWGQGRLGRVVAYGCWAYAAAITLFWLVLYGKADDWWWVTVFLFGPRWLVLLPLCLLGPAALLLRPRLLAPLGLAGFVALGPIMGFCVPWRAALATGSSGPRIRVLTFNLHYERRLDVRGLDQLLTDVQPDLVLLQGYQLHHSLAWFQAQGWQVREDGQLFVASRYPLQSCEPLTDPAVQPEAAIARYTLRTPIGALDVINLHLTTPREGLASVLASGWGGAPVVHWNSVERRHEAEAVRQWARPGEQTLLIAGDFNLPAESTIYRQCWGDFRDAFSSAGLGLGHTFVTRWSGVRIDHILAGAGWRCRRCWVGPFLGSPHRPVIADLEWMGFPA